MGTAAPHSVVVTIDSTNLYTLDDSRQLRFTGNGTPSYIGSMAGPSEESRYQALAEQTLSELKTIREYVSDVPQIKEDVAQLKDDVTEIKADVSVIKQVVRDHSGRLTSVEGRADRLEEAA